MPATPGALLITPQGDIVQIDLPATSSDRRAVMRAVIRCEYLAVLALTSRLDMWHDEAHRLNYEDEINEGATLLARRYLPTACLHGPVVVTGGADEDGNTVPLDRDKLVALLTSMADSI
ncbi:DUF3846 domain-containing protein [Streptomyces sp. NPDC001073]